MKNRNKKNVVIALISFVLAGCFNAVPITPPQRYDRAVKELAKATSERERFYALNDAAKESFILGKVEEARKHAEELKEMTPRYQTDWNYGNAIQDWNLVLGKIAIKEGRIEEAKAHLLAAGKSPGSPQMNSFGPNMSLAKDLLYKGEREVALQYLDLCRSFWKMHNRRLDEWSREIKQGKIPDFGANLVY